VAVVLTLAGGHLASVSFASSPVLAQTTATTEAAADTGPSPIAPEIPEVAWTAGAFVVFAVLMRLVLFPRLKKGMDARYGKIRGDLEGADATRAAAHRELAEYHAALAEVKAEAAQKLDAARAQLDQERHARLAEVNTTIAERKARAAGEVESAKQAASSQVADAVANVATNGARRLLGREPDAAVVRAAVDEVMSAGVAR
jgi:F-type H+-transporting ATPase subunit b